MDMLNDWYLQWDMDGCQWDVLDITMYEEFPPIGYSMHTSSWVGCLKFVYDHLMDKTYTVRKVKVYCKDDYFELDKAIITYVLKEYYPEEFI
jgi:hypothetical protein